MKKTIAILLVLVIGMVGVFAADTADLYLTTTVNAINEMKITAASAESAGWTDVSSLADPEVIDSFTSSAYPDAENAVEIDPFQTAAQVVGKLWTRSNNRVGYTVLVSASELVSDDANSSETISYTVSGGENTVATGATAVVYVNQVAVAGLQSQMKTVSVTLAESVSSLSAATYTGNITFEFLSN